MSVRQLSKRVGIIERQTYGDGQFNLDLLSDEELERLEVVLLKMERVPSEQETATATTEQLAGYFAGLSDDEDKFLDAIARKTRRHA